MHDPKSGTSCTSFRWPYPFPSNIVSKYLGPLEPTADLGWLLPVAQSSPGHVPVTTQARGERIIRSARNIIDIEETASLAHLVHTGTSTADAEADTMLVSAEQCHHGQGSD